MRARLFALLLLFVAVSVDAQMAPPTPAPELKKLDFMTGDWTTEGTFIPGPPGTPPSKFSSTSHGEWQQGNFFLVITTDSNLEGMGKMHEIAVVGYDPDKKVYTYRNFNSMGQAETSTGTLDGDTWMWTGEEHYGGMTFQGRVMMKVISPTSYTIKFELSQDGTNWMPAMDGKATKK
jgi:Protein of unknown function (DUF1579)